MDRRNNGVIVKLLPDQVANYWPYMKEGIYSSLPPMVRESSSTLDNILLELLFGIKECWVSFRKESVVDVIGVIITEIIRDRISELSSLSIYSIYAFKQTKGRDWMEAVEALSKYARFKNCSEITAYSNVSKVLRVVERFGGDVSYRYISIPI